MKNDMAKDDRTTPKKTNYRMIALLAAVAGAIAATAAIYFMGHTSGNEISAAMQSVEKKNETAGQCAISQQALDAIKNATKGQIAVMQAAENPISLSYLAFNDAEGQPVTLGDFKGKTVLLNLWASWCAPCREEMPALDRLQAAKGGDDFTVVALNIDTGDNSKPQRFLSETGIKNLTLYRDKSMKSFNDLKRNNLAYGLPATLLIDANGCQVAAMNGPAEWDSEDAMALIDVARANAHKQSTSSNVGQ